MSNSIYWKIIVPVMVLLLLAIGLLISVKSQVIDIFSAIIVAAIFFSISCIPYHEDDNPANKTNNEGSRRHRRWKSGPADSNNDRR